MKTHFLLLALLVGGLAVAHAQEAAAPGSPVETGTSQVLPSLDALLAPVAPPPAVEPAEVAPASDAPIASAPAAAPKKGTAEQLREAIRIRELKTLVEEDPAVLAQKATAECAKTEAGRCVAMRNYYTLLYTKIEALDPSLQSVLEAQLYTILKRYEQHRVRPSVLIEPIAALPGSNSADHAAAAAPAPEDEILTKKKARKR